MIVNVCPDTTVSYKYEKPPWCDAKLPCGRCLTSLDGFGECRQTRLLFSVELPCESCKARFLCLTIASIDGRESYEVQKQILKLL